MPTNHNQQNYKYDPPIDADDILKSIKQKKPNRTISRKGTTSQGPVTDLQFQQLMVKG